MSIWFISRHPGAIAWARSQNLGITHWCSHLRIDDISAGDVVIGTLPVHLAAQVCQRKAKFVALSINVTEEQRGKEITLDQMGILDCELQEFIVTAKSEDRR